MKITVLNVPEQFLLSRGACKYTPFIRAGNKKAVALSDDSEVIRSCEVVSDLRTKSSRKGHRPRFCDEIQNNLANKFDGYLSMILKCTRLLSK